MQRQGNPEEQREQLKRKEEEATKSWDDAFATLEEQPELAQKLDKVKNDIPKQVNDDKAKLNLQERQEEAVKEDEQEEEVVEPAQTDEVEEVEEVEVEDYSDSLNKLNELSGKEFEREEAAKDDGEGKHTRADDEDSKEEIQELLNDPHGNPKTKKRVEKLLGKINSLKSELKAKVDPAEVAQLKQKIAELEEAPKVDPISEEDRKELTMLRRRFSLETDPEFRQEFDDKIKQSVGIIEDIIDQHVDSKDAEEIKRIGFEKFVKNSPSAYRQFVELLEERNPADADLVKAKYGEVRSLRSLRDRKAQELTADAEKWAQEQSQKKVNTQHQQAEYQKQIESARKQLESQMIEKDPMFAKLPEKGLEGEKLKKVQAENARRDKIHTQIRKNLRPKTHEEQVSIMYQAALAHDFADKLKQAQRTIKQLQEQSQKIRAKQSQTKPPSEARKDKAPPKSFTDALDAWGTTRSGSVVRAN